MKKIKITSCNRSKERGAFNQFISIEGVEPSCRSSSNMVVCPTDALHEGRDGSRRAELANQFHWTDINTELKRCRCNKRPEVTRPKPRLNQSPPSSRQTSMVCSDLEMCVIAVFGVITKAFCQLVGDSLGHASRVDEDQGGSMLGHTGSNVIEHLGELSRTSYCLEIH